MKTKKPKVSERWQRTPKVELPREVWQIIATLLKKASPDELEKLERHMYKIRNAGKPATQL
jgi:hypothetical protein